MSSSRDQKIATSLVELAARFIAREAGRQTLITPTRAELHKDRKRMTVFISVFPETDEAHALSFLTRHRDDFRKFVKEEGRFGILPIVRFEIDAGEVHRRRLDELSKEIEERNP